MVSAAWHKTRNYSVDVTQMVTRIERHLLKHAWSRATSSRVPAVACWRQVYWMTAVVRLKRVTETPEAVAVTATRMYQVRSLAVRV